MGDGTCCLEFNLGPEETDSHAGPGETFRRCQICNRRHFTLVIDQGMLEVKESEPENDQSAERANTNQM